MAIGVLQLHQSDSIDSACLRTDEFACFLNDSRMIGLCLYLDCRGRVIGRIINEE